MSEERETTRTGQGIPRWLDAGLASVSLLMAAPLLAAIALGVRLSSPGPILFRQQRVGRAGRPFTMLKFRSMRVNGDGARITAAADERITRFGRLLRKTKLDELPQLWNVARGDMALVGPRPELPAYVSLDDPRWIQVLSAKPGLTDPVTQALRSEEDLLAAVPGDHEEFYRAVLLPQKLEGYLDYLHRRSFRSDVGVLCGTLVAICLPRPRRGGISRRVSDTTGKR